MTLSVCLCLSKYVAFIMTNMFQNGKSQKPAQFCVISSVGSPCTATERTRPLLTALADVCTLRDAFLSTFSLKGAPLVQRGEHVYLWLHLVVQISTLKGPVRKDGFCMNSHRRKTVCTSYAPGTCPV